MVQNSAAVMLSNAGMSVIKSQLDTPLSARSMATPRSARGARPNFTPREKPYEVGVNRVKAQLRVADSTLDEASQLRRLRQVLGCPASQSESVHREVRSAKAKIDDLVKRVNADTYEEIVVDLIGHSGIKQGMLKQQQVVDSSEPEANLPSSDHEAEGNATEKDAAATKLQAKFRGNQDRQMVTQKRETKKQEDQAATKLQANWRGKTARDNLKNQVGQEDPVGQEDEVGQQDQA